VSLTDFCPGHTCIPGLILPARRRKPCRAQCGNSPFGEWSVGFFASDN